MFQNIAEILKSFSGKQRFTVLILLLLTILCSIFIKSYFTSTDLAPMQKQLNECVASQGNLVNQNALLVGKTKELTDGYLKIDSMLTHMKPDTVYITLKPLKHSHVDSSTEMLAMEKIEPNVSSKKTTKIVNGNSKKLIGDLHQLILSKTKN